MSGQRLVALYSAEFSAIHRNEDSLAWQSLVSTYENNIQGGSAGFSMFQLCASRADSPGMAVWCQSTREHCAQEPDLADILRSSWQAVGAPFPAPALGQSQQVHAVLLSSTMPSHSLRSAWQAVDALCLALHSASARALQHGSLMPVYKRAFSL